MHLWQKYLVIAGLYLAQGLPGGLLGHSLPVLFAQQGMSAFSISLISFLAFPWAIKLLWSKYLDQSTQGHLLFVSSLCGALAMWLILAMYPLEAWTHQSMFVLFLLICVLANFFMASQDVLTDSLTVRMLSTQDRGVANSIQVIGYKFGMLISGAGLLYLFISLKWQLSISLLAAMLVVCYLPYLFFYYSNRDLRSIRDRHTKEIKAHAIDHERSLLEHLKDFMRLPSMWYWMAIIACYKLGDGLISSIVKKFWVEYHIDEASIAKAILIGITLGMVGGFIAGLIWRSSTHKKSTIKKLLLTFCLLQLSSMVGYYYLSQTQGQYQLWWGIAMYEQVVDVMSTVILFAAMMQICRKETAGIDYTFQMTVLLIFSGMMHPIGGLIADHFGFQVVFLSAMCALIPVISLLLYPAKVDVFSRQDVISRQDSSIAAANQTPSN